MTSLSVFSFNDNQVRIVTVDGEPWFVAKDVLEAIETTTTVTALKTLVVEDLGEEFVINQHLQTNGGNQEMMLLSEPALTLFVSRSRTELGKSMNRWIHTEVLPAIRKTGRYEVIPQPEPTHALPPADVRVDKLMTNLEKLGIDITNPRYHQCIQDFVMDKIMGAAAGPALPASNEPQWLGVAEKAEQMGYPIKLVSQYRSALGRYVSSHIDEFGLEKCREKRLCNGTQREINLFKDCPELERVIAEYMDAKVLAS